MVRTPLTSPVSPCTCHSLSVPDLCWSGLPGSQDETSKIIHWVRLLMGLTNDFNILQGLLSWLSCYLAGCSFSGPMLCLHPFRFSKDYSVLMQILNSLPFCIYTLILFLTLRLIKLRHIIHITGISFP